MEKIQVNKSKKIRFLGFTGIALCALCYLLPLAGAIFGFGALASLATHLEKLSMLFLALSAIGFGVYLFRKSRKSKSCATDCGCKPDTETTS